MRDSDRYMAQAEAVLRLAGRAGSPAEKQVYETIAQGWRKLAGEAKRDEQHEDDARLSARESSFRAANND